MDNVRSPTGQTRIEAVMSAIHDRLTSRSLTPGSRLPSVRAFARTMRLSTSTVVEAYERLAAEGLIRSRPGSGFYVTAPLAPLSLAEIGPRLDREIDPLWISRQSLEASDDLLKPGCGWLPPSWMPQASIRRALRALARADEATLTDYGEPLGLPGLRALLSRRMAESGIVAEPSQIMLTDSGTQALDLLCRFLLEPGDTVLIDDPCYFNFSALLRAHRLTIVSVPYTANGPDLERFAQVLQEHRPRLYITNAAIHNPTGATLSPIIAHRLLKLAEAAGLTIVEDDILADFEETPSPRLAALDGLSHVIRIGSFSKTLSASIRCGFIVARPGWMEKLVDLKIATTFGGGRFSAEIVLALLTDGSYRKHVEGLRQRLARARDETVARLQQIGITPWLIPSAGMLLWCKLPDGVDAASLARACLKDNVVLAPGNAFSLAQTASNFMRFNVAQSNDERIFRSIERALRQSICVPS
jgi:DNA-binding transcriptional MocR family regulator